MPDNSTGPLKPIKWYKSLSSGKERQEAGVFLVEGTRAIGQVISNNPGEITAILSTHELPEAYQGYASRIITANQLRSISTSRTPQSLIAVVRIPPKAYSDDLPDNPGEKILMLEGIQDPGNVGTLIRSAAAFGFSGVILTEKCADPFSPKCIQSTAGTILSLWIRRTSLYMAILEKLKVNGYALVSADIHGKDDPSFLQKQGKLVLALGNEASGLSKPLLNLSSFILRIPISGEKAESLNVAACGAICMYLSRPGH